MPRCLVALTLICVSLSALAADTPPAWDSLDWKLERSILVSRYLFHDQQPDNPWDLYTATLGPDETPLAQLLAEFDALDDAGRSRAREAAAERLSRGRLVMLDKIYPLRNAVEERDTNLIGGFADPTPGFAVAMGTAIELFADAVRRDPTLAEAWYHLAYFTSLAGDRARSTRAREAFFMVWDRQTDDARQRLQPLWEVSVLDEAWNRRDDGRYDDCLTWLDRHQEKLPRTVDGPGVAPRVEARLIRGLVHAERNEVAAALATLPGLPLMSLPTRATAPQRTYLDVGAGIKRYLQRFGDDMNPYHNPRPKWQDQTVDNLARAHRESSYLRRWVKGWTSLRRGYDAETVQRDLGRVETEMEFQPRLAWRWWQDQGLIYEELGELELARVCWSRAAVYRPLFIYHPTGQGQGIASVHGLAGTSRPYFLAYGTFMITGSPWSYAANAALASEVEDTALERTMLRQTARLALDQCVRRGFHAAEARALRGRLSFIEERYDEAWSELLAAWDALEPRDLAPDDVALMLGLCRFNAGRWRDAEPWLNTYTHRAPDNSVGWLALGLSRAMQGRDEDAFAAIDEAALKAPDDATILYNRGLLNYRLQRREAARIDFRRAKELWPDNPQIAQMVRVVDEETQYDLEMSAAPMRMNIPQQQRTRLAELLAAGRQDDTAGELGDLVSATGEERERMLAELERRQQNDPSRLNRTRLAQALLLAGESQRVQAVLGSAWPDGLSPLEQRLLLYADRNTGHADRAVEVATSRTWQVAEPDLELTLLAATILAEHDHQDLAAQVVARGLVAAPGNQALLSLQRSLERSP